MLYETLALAFWMLEAMNDFLSAFCFKWLTSSSVMSSLVPFFPFCIPLRRLHLYRWRLF